MMRVSPELPLKLFTAAAAVGIVAAAVGVTALQWIAKPLLAPLIIWHLVRQGRRDLVIWGLGFATAGDVALLLPGRAAFVVGLTFFFGTQVCLLLAFLNRGKPQPVVSAFWALAWVTAGALFRGQGAPVAVPLIVYGLGLSAMAAAAAGVSRTIAAGGALFVVANVLIGFEAPPVLVTTAYAAALALIGIGWSRPQQQETEPEGARAEEPVRRARAWAGHDAGSRFADDGAVYLRR